MNRPSLVKRISNFTINSLNKIWLTRKITFKTRVLLGYEYYKKPQINIEKRVFGSQYGGHCVALNRLNKDSVVYSVGLGLDISFDEQLIVEYGLEVHGFDPTPKSIEHLNQTGMPEGFVLHKYGISNEDGTQIFHIPVNPDHVSHSTTNHENTSAEAIEVVMKTLTTTMQELGHNSIDLLKMDIEGSEYAVIEEICSRGIDVKQILIEFHHHFDNISVSSTKSAVKKLSQMGYQVFNISPNGHEVSFLLSGN